MKYNIKNKIKFTTVLEFSKEQCKIITDKL